MKTTVHQSVSSYVIAALQHIDPYIGALALPLLQASPLPVSSVLTTLLNDIANRPEFAHAGAGRLPYR